MGFETLSRPPFGMSWDCARYPSMTPNDETRGVTEIALLVKYGEKSNKARVRA